MVSIIIITLNSSDCIKECLNSIVSQATRDYEVIVVDNASADNTIELLNSFPLPITLIKNRENLGFARANNQAIAMAKGDYLLLLNPDVAMEGNYIEELLGKADEDKKIGAVTGKLLKKPFPQTAAIIDSTGHIAYKCRYFKDRGENEEDKGQYDMSGYVFSVCAAASLYRKEMLEGVKIKGEYFDEDFFSYWEDVDLCWRSQLMGWKSYYNSKAVAYHARGHSRDKKAEKTLIFKNRILTLMKNDSIKNLLKDIHHILIYEFFDFLQNLFFSPYVFKNLLTCFKLLPEILEKRSFISEKKSVHDLDIHQWFVYKKNMYSKLLIKAVQEKFK
ncbi:MAG: hypothetical protein A3C43_06310 [Candidatus Schekmanbacteria bacterium RIFCSPHIGHO2_02_FULL_38_11]|uniref:Glycosyltransferase 2-like domain-containing protein n=1 Tax=Candidatus Schekmanbacteria bacterium RIFCSPLOWO2_12_FULL_38_15 TaxID=1817883 RepID=A0A1F7SDM2_9BACT|nr:MAG: hypothetical protein A2043_01755 [Candidatus Schekmanbacteria bacterium GWA2_38_9]OGL48350.1 MAG: hypothetical protein A3H37_05095 [Candidatus Schekmanbacteria bacterium RIFCSPLOWO2_02_FULL_38_14]OGL48486.1 MAG: hypothetical protein A3C43_06310 [Candidatus Schekmanbacteria bacterium RIFCSPHIGHO2_02_FULL_38_11]OGL51876.1 MAG: hypothetical protein A3G31_05700 [Candidatus Schekmanbacteria bacterium RIFCSPLOWO2_12_FULL_38_15]